MRHNVGCSIRPLAAEAKQILVGSCATSSDRFYTQPMVVVRGDSPVVCLNTCSLAAVAIIGPKGTSDRCRMPRDHFQSTNSRPA